MRDGTAALEWPTTAEVLALRSELGWSSPIKPLEPGDLWCVWCARGTFEWMAHPADASRYIADGIVVDGVLLMPHRVERWPLLNAWQLRAQSSSTATGFVDGAAVA